MKKMSIYTALTLLDEFHGIQLDEDTFETYALSAYNKIGNKDYRVYRLRAVPEADIDGGWFVCKPCNMDSIEAITLDFESALETSSTTNYAGLQNHAVEQWVEATKRMPNELYASGKFVKYKELGDRIYFTEPYPVVNILYKGWFVDENGLPFVNEKEMNAIVAYCAYVVDNKKARLTKDQSTFQMAQLEYQLWQKACSAARSPEEISQNAMNEILDAQTSWGRHSHGASSTKPII